MKIEPVLAAAGFTWIDWGILAGYLAFTTWLGARLAGKQSTIRDFFLGGRKLPWWAVAGSSIATEISAVTFVGVPALIFAARGDFTYLQCGLIGSLLARLIVAYVLVPAYFEREIYSPYDYMGNRLGGGVRNVATALFTVGGIVGQAARVYLTAAILQLILGEHLAHFASATGISALTWSIWIIGTVSVAWTLLGGITTVIWTDVILFLVFLVGAVVALVTVAGHVDGGMTEIVRVGKEAGKFRLFDLDTDLSKPFTLWAAVIAVTWFNTGVFGTDQLMAQRMFCCRSQRDARWSVIASQFGVVVPALMLFVGVGLFAYYRQHPPTGDDAARLAARNDDVFPIFIIREMPTGLRGLVIAGIFAAAISSLESILAALSQTTLTTLVIPMRERKARRLGLAATTDDDRAHVRASRWLVVFYGVLLSFVAQAMLPIQRAGGERYDAILNLALSLATYTSGGLLAVFLMAFLPVRRSGFGLWFSAPLSVVCVIAFAWKKEWVPVVIGIAGALLLIGLIVALARRGAGSGEAARKIAILAAGVGVAFAAWRWIGVERGGVLVPLSWPWQAPFGTLVAFTFGWLLGDRTPERGA